MLSIKTAKKLDQLCHNACPSGLVTRPESSPIVAVEILIEEDVVLPLRIGLEFIGGAVDRSSSGLVAEEDFGQPVSNLSRNLKQIHQITRTGRTLDLEVVAIIKVVGQQCAD